MAEVSFVLKSLLISVVIVFFMQIPIGGQRLESLAVNWIHASTVGRFLHETAEGGVLAVRDGVQASTGFVKNLVNRKSVSEDTTKAGRLNFEFKRSSASKKTPPESEE